MKKIIVANWKMAPSSLKEAKKLLSQLPNANSQLPSAKLIICPPFIYLSNLRLQRSSRSQEIHFGAQNCFWQYKGAYTGEISPLMLKNLGVKYVIIGHSERRKYLKETDEMINKKIKAAISAKLSPVLCVGESEEERKKGQTKRVLKNQLNFSLQGISKLFVAYEPIWAIGAGKACNDEQALDIIKFIKKILSSKVPSSKFQGPSFKVLYGGSVKAKNILDFLKHKEIDGVLIGEASSNIKEFNEILKKLKSKIS